MKQEKLDKINNQCKNTLIQTLGIRFTDIGNDFIIATMPVNEVTHQPFGMLHGGASVALAESAGSYLSNIIIDENHIALGTQINAHHARSKKSGTLTATAKIIKKGRTLHVVEIKITDEDDNLICFSTMTNIILKKENFV